LLFEKHLENLKKKEEFESLLSSCVVIKLGLVLLVLVSYDVG